MSASSDDWATTGERARNSASSAAATVRMCTWYRLPGRAMQPRRRPRVSGQFLGKEPSAMVDVLSDRRAAVAAVQELRAHERTFQSFGKLVLFAILHIVLVLGCLALAFLGSSPLIALILGVGGTAALIAAFAIL